MYDQNPNIKANNSGKNTVASPQIMTSSISLSFLPHDIASFNVAPDYPPSLKSAVLICIPKLCFSTL